MTHVTSRDREATRTPNFCRDVAAVASKVPAERAMVAFLVAVRPPNLPPVGSRRKRPMTLRGVGIGVSFALA
jgi:hypothetical protein